jgi:proteasome lid subunit RPN8/RPN11
LPVLEPGDLNPRTAVKLSQEHLQTIRTHAESTYPDECCGVILGYLANEGKTVVEIMPTENVWNTEAAAEFLAERTTKSKKRQYAIRLYAWQGYSYVIDPSEKVET